MTNTQSPAPGVAATIEQLMSLADDFADDRGEATRPVESQTYRAALESALHVALQGGVSADVTDDQVRAALNTFNNDNNETGTRAMRRALEQFLASRTPAPGMAGGVLTDRDLRHIADNCNILLKLQDREAVEFGRAVLRHAALSAPHPSPAPQAATEAQKMLNWLLDGKRSKRIWNHVLTDEEKAGHNFIKDVLQAAITASGRDAS